MLIIFHDRKPGASHGKARAVQCVHEFAFAAFGLEADAGAARLKRFGVGAGRNFHELIRGGEPHFDVVRF